MSGVGQGGRSGRAGRSEFACTECDWVGPRWLGRCPTCSAWGSLQETARTPSGPRGASTLPGRVSAPPRATSEEPERDVAPVPVGMPELDRVLGGGLVPGSAVLLAGEPGVGKSTLLLQLAVAVADRAETVLFVSGEETVGQVQSRAARLGARHPSLLVAAETRVDAILAHLDLVQPSLLVVDSVQTVSSDRVDGVPGGVSQVREVAGVLVEVAKRRHCTLVLVGHVTKDGAIAGPRTLEHLVDVVLHVDGEQHSQLRLLRGVKNRYGPSDEVGCFEMLEEGMRDVPDPSGLFVSHRGSESPGCCLTVTMQGRRAMLAEIQALTLPATGANPRRTAVGLDSARTAMLLAVLERRTATPMRESEVYVSTVGGARITDPAVDLAVLLAMAATARDTALPAGMAAIGEVGLGGEVRRSSSLTPRLGEAARTGVTTVLVPPGVGRVPDGLDVLEVPDVRTAVEAALSVGLRAIPGGRPWGT